MVRSTIGVITNARPDHFEAMGRSLDQVAQALSGTIPAGAVLVTESGPYEPLFRERCAAAGTRICVPSADDIAPGETPHFHLLVENLAFVRAVGLQAGLPVETVDGDSVRMQTRRVRCPPSSGIVRRLWTGTRPGARGPTVRKEDVRR